MTAKANHHSRWLKMAASAVVGVVVTMWPAHPSAASAAARGAPMQQGVGTSPINAPTPNPRSPGSNVPFSADPGDSPSSEFQETLRAKRNDERQKRLESDTQRLLALANQLKSEVAASGAETMTPEMLRQMDEIEKLAKSVKDRMRS